MYSQNINIYIYIYIYNVSDVFSFKIQNIFSKLSSFKALQRLGNKVRHYAFIKAIHDCQISPFDLVYEEKISYVQMSSNFIQTIFTVFL